MWNFVDPQVGGFKNCGSTKWSRSIPNGFVETQVCDSNFCGSTFFWNQHCGSTKWRWALFEVFCVFFDTFLICITWNCRKKLHLTDHSEELWTVEPRQVRALCSTDETNYRPGFRAGHRSVYTPLHFHGLYMDFTLERSMVTWTHVPPIVITVCAGLRCNCGNHEAPNMVAGCFNLCRFTSTSASLKFLWMNPLDAMRFMWPSMSWISYWIWWGGFGFGLHSLPCVVDPPAGRIAPQTDGLEIFHNSCHTTLTAAIVTFFFRVVPLWGPNGI